MFFKIRKISIILILFILIIFSIHIYIILIYMLNIKVFIYFYQSPFLTSLIQRTWWKTYICITLNRSIILLIFIKLFKLSFFTMNIFLFDSNIRFRLSIFVSNLISLAIWIFRIAACIIQSRLRINTFRTYFRHIFFFVFWFLFTFRLLIICYFIFLFFFLFYLFRYIFILIFFLHYLFFFNRWFF